MSFHQALAARIGAAWMFAMATAFAAIAAPAWALVLIVVAGAGVCLASRRADSLEQDIKRWVGVVTGVLAVGLAWLTMGGAGGLTALVVWRVVAEALATETQLQALARRLPPNTMDRGFARACHLAAGPVLALALMFGVHQATVFGHTGLILPPLWTAALLTLAGVALMDWLVRRLVDWRLGMASRALTLHVGGHHLVFLAIGLGGADAAALVLGLLAWRILRSAPPLPGVGDAFGQMPPQRVRPRAFQVRAAAR